MRLQCCYICECVSSISTSEIFDEFSSSMAWIYTIRPPPPPSLVHCDFLQLVITNMMNAQTSQVGATLAPLNLVP
jgi:hypothetical protein